MDRRAGAIVSETIATNNEYMEKLTQRVGLLAAEAISHGMADMNFVALCMQAYRKAKGEG